jgi:hypothetical protein
MAVNYRGNLFDNIGSWSKPKSVRPISFFSSSISRLNESLEQSSVFLSKIQSIALQKIPNENPSNKINEDSHHRIDSQKQNLELDQQVKETETKPDTKPDSKQPELDFSEVIPVLMFACNRVTVNLALDSLLKARKDPNKFPIIVSQVESL